VDAHPDLAAIEQERKAVFARLSQAEADYYAAARRYLQCLVTPFDDQDGTTAVTFDRTRKPSDEKDDWTKLVAAGDVAAGTRCQYYVHRYDGPQGSGFILGARVTWDNAVWVYEEHHGLEDRPRPAGWVQIPEVAW
jgi:hypothetical protein